MSIVIRHIFFLGYIYIMNIKNFTTKTISFDFTLINSVMKDIFISHDVHEVVLKTVTLYSGSPLTNYIVNIHSNFVTDNILCSIPSVLSFHESYNIPYKPISQNIRGTYNFWITNEDGVAVSNEAFVLSMTLVFIEYDKK